MGKNYFSTAAPHDLTTFSLRILRIVGITIYLENATMALSFQPDNGPWWYSLGEVASIKLLHPRTPLYDYFGI